MQLDDGRILDPYFAEGIGFEVRENQKVNFDYMPATFPSPCSIAEQAIILTCVEEEVIPATPTDHCVCDVCDVSDPLSLPWVQAELAYPAAIGMDVFWNPVTKQVLLASIPVGPDAGSFIFDCTGNRICHVGGIGGSQIHNCPFDPEILELIGTFRKAGDTPLCGSDGSTYTSYCAAECARVSIVNEGECVTPQKNLFTDYPWLNGLVDTSNCEGTIISEYDLGPYAFIYVESPFSSILFFEDGTYYCFSQSGYDCLSLYNLSEKQLTGQYVCGGPDFGDYPWLSAVLDVEDCCENTQAIEYQSGIYAFIYVSSSTTCSDGLGTLYFQDGTYYCGEVSNYDCRAAYNLNLAEGKVIWECNNNGYNLEKPADSRLTVKAAQTSKLLVYPNPVRNLLNVEIVDEITGRLRLYDIQGRILVERQLAEIANSNLSIDFSVYEKGIYLLEWNADGQSEVKKIFKQ